MKILYGLVCLVGMAIFAPMASAGDCFVNEVRSFRVVERFAVPERVIEFAEVPNLLVVERLVVPEVREFVSFRNFLVQRNIVRKSFVDVQRQRVAVRQNFVRNRVILRNRNVGPIRRVLGFLFLR